MLPPFRRLIEWLASALLVVLLVRTFLVMGLVVPIAVSGSSMAPHYIGPHVRFDCPRCRQEILVASDQLPGSWFVCPRCRHKEIALESGIHHAGESLWIDRTSFEFCSPRRWEPVVFRCPEDPRQLCIKRVLALEGETVRLEGGDLLIDGWRQRKDLRQQQELRILIHRESESLRRWQEANTRATDHWRWREGAWLGRVADGAASLRFGADDPQLTDDLLYNLQAPRKPVPVPDLMITGKVELHGEAQLSWRCEINQTRYEVTWDCRNQQARWRIGSTAGGHWSVREGSVQVRHPADAGSFTFSLFDGQLLWALDDEVRICESFEPVSAPIVRQQVEMALAADSDQPAEVRLEGLSLWRDIYYEQRWGDRALQAPASSRVNADSYFVVGDNQALSLDSRNWSTGTWAGGIPSKLLVGKPLESR